MHHVLFTRMKKNRAYNILQEKGIVIQVIHELFQIDTVHHTRDNIAYSVDGHCEDLWGGDPPQPL